MPDNNIIKANIPKLKQTREIIKVDDEIVRETITVVSLNEETGKLEKTIELKTKTDAWGHLIDPKNNIGRCKCGMHQMWKITVP